VSIETKIRETFDELAREVSASPDAWQRLEKNARRHQRRRTGVASILAVATIVACLVWVPRLRSTVSPQIVQTSPASPTKSNEASGSTDPTTMKAQEVLDALLQAQPQGRATAAAYVETTTAKYVSANPVEAGASIAKPADAILVIKVFGTFHAISHGGPAGVNTDATTIVIVYDERLGTNVEATYFSEPASPDVPGSGATADGRVSYDLRLLGTPQTLKV
jgi:hypothetical protein